MKKLFMLLALGALVSCASIYAQDEEDFRIQMDDDENSVYQMDDDNENFNIGYIDDMGDE